MFALNCTELPGAAIDACGAGISLRGISVAAGGKANNALCFDGGEIRL